MDSTREEVTEIRLLYVRGLPIPNNRFFSREKFESGVDYKAREDDIIICTYPKCGTHLLAYLTWLILSKAKPLSSIDELRRKAIPFMDMTGSSVLDNHPSPRAMHYHLPYHLIPKNPKAKYMYLFRNPKDVVVSYYHLVKITNRIEIPFGDFFDLFLKGKVAYGNYFDHVLSWYEHREDPNIFLLSFEQLQSDRRMQLFRIAKFIGQEYFDMLKKDEALVETILQMTDFNTMKRDLFVEDANAGLSLSAGNSSKTIKAADELRSIPFLRKGIVGDWKNHLTPEQIERIERIMTEKLEGTEIADFWTFAEPYNSVY